MRLVSCEFDNKIWLGVEKGARIFLPYRHPKWDASINSMLALLDAGEVAWKQLTEVSINPEDSFCVDRKDVKFHSPIPRPRQNIICLGLNYLDHVSETTGESQEQVKLPRSPVVFTKAANSMNGPYSEIEIDTAVSSKMDWEAELGVIIGKPGLGISQENAMQHVFGYTVINDITARDRQKWHKQFYIGKSYKGCCPMGPAIVTADEIDDPHSLQLRSWVNGDLKQESNTRHQIFKIANVISVLSQGMELEAGDIIATGTPSGVGYARTPPEFLMPGDIVECEVENIGKISNRIVQRKPGGVL